MIPASGETKFAVDTSYAVAAFKGTIIPAYPLTSAFFPAPVVGELRFGVLAGRKAGRSPRSIEPLLSEERVLPITAETTEVYAEVRYRLRVAGTPIPENDLWIAALCVEHRLSLLTLDRHFERVEGLSLAS